MGVKPGRAPQTCWTLSYIAQLRKINMLPRLAQMLSRPDPLRAHLSSLMRRPMHRTSPKQMSYTQVRRKSRSPPAVSHCYWRSRCLRGFYARRSPPSLLLSCPTWPSRNVPASTKPKSGQRRARLRLQRSWTSSCVSISRARATSRRASDVSAAWRCWRSGARWASSCARKAAQSTPRCAHIRWFCPHIACCRSAPLCSDRNCVGRT